MQITVSCRMVALRGFLYLFARSRPVARGADVASCTARGAASQRILLGLPRARLLGAPFSCAFFNAHVFEFLVLSSDKSGCFVACRHILTMLYLTYNDLQNNHNCSKSREHTAYAMRSATISRDHTRMPANQCRYNTVCHGH